MFSLRTVSVQFLGSILFVFFDGYYIHGCHMMEVPCFASLKQIIKKQLFFRIFQAGFYKTIRFGSVAKSLGASASNVVFFPSSPGF